MWGSPFNAGRLKRRGLVARPCANPWLKALPVLCFSLTAYLAFVVYLKWRDA